MKVLHVVHGYPPALGGTQTLMARLSEGLVARHGDEVTVLTTNALSNEHFRQQDPRTLPPGASRIGGVAVRRFPVFNRGSRLRLALANLAYRWRLPGNDWARALHDGPLVPGLARAVARADADLVCAASFPLLHMHAALRGGHRGGRPVVLVTGLHAEDVWGFDRPMIYRAARRAAACVAYTAAERRYLAERGVPASRVAVIGGGVDPQPPPPEAGAAWRRRHHLADRPLAAFLGKQAPHKEIDTLLAAMPRVWERLPDACLAIAGEPTAHSPRLRALARALPGDRRAQVLFFDAPDDAERAALLAACDLLVLPSRHESFGLVFLEAWVCGKPVIGARLAAVADVIDDGRDGLLAPVGRPDALAAALVQLLTDPDLGNRLGAAGRRKALDRYTWDHVVDRFRALYARLLAARQ